MSEETTRESKLSQYTCECPGCQEPIELDASGAFVEHTFSSLEEMRPGEPPRRTQVRCWWSGVVAPTGTGIDEQAVATLPPMRMVETRREKELSDALRRCRDTMEECSRWVDDVVEIDLIAEVERVDSLLGQHLLDSITPTTARLRDLHEIAVVADRAMSQGQMTRRVSRSRSAAWWAARRAGR